MVIVIRIAVLLAIALLVLVGLPGYVLATRDYAGRVAHVSQHQRPIVLTAARGETVVVGVRIDDGIGGRWASQDGLRLSLAGTDVRLPVVGPRPADWGDTLRTSALHGGDPYDVIGSAAVPASIGGPEERVLTGSLSGDLAYPSGGAGFGFENRKIEVAVPVEIRLVSSGTAERVSGHFLSRMFALADLALASILFLLATGALVRAVPTRARASEGRPDVASPGAALAEIAIGAVIVLVVGGGALMGVLTAATLGGIDHPPDGVAVVNLAIAAMTAGAAGVFLLAVFMDPS
jgi:hypothetical protein